MGADDATSTHDDHVEPDSRPAPNDDSANSGEPSRKDRFLEKWGAVPTPLRKTVVLVIGATLLCIGGVLVVLPGPFTLPFIIAALAVLASEFIWAERVFDKGKDVTEHVVGRVRQVPLWIIIMVGVLVASGVAATAYWWFIHRT